MHRRLQRHMQLIDCQQHGTHAELFVVEGESAAQSVSAICDAEFQAVLPLQGKPLNAAKVAKNKVLACPLYQQFASALGLKNAITMVNDLNNLRYGRIFLLFDPDADGIHIGALFLLYVKRWIPELIDDGRVYLLHAPMFGLHSETADGTHHTQFAYLPQQLAALKAQVSQQGRCLVRTDHFQSVGSVPPHVLASSCIDPHTRQIHAVTHAHVAAVQAMFG